MSGEMGKFGRGGQGVGQGACEEGHGENMQNFLKNFWGKG